MKIWVEPAGVTAPAEKQETICTLELHSQIILPLNVFSAVVSIPCKDHVITQTEECKGVKKF